MVVKFTVLGSPKSKGRPEFFRVKNRVGTRTPEDTVLYENLVRAMYQYSHPGVRFPDGSMLDMRILAYYQIPKSVSKRKRDAMIAGELRPTKTPDADNIIKVVADSLNKIAYRDDAQIVDTQIRKFYSDRPRVEVTIRDIPTQIERGIQS